MALIVRIAVFLGVLGICKSQIDGVRSILGSQRKDPRYGRPVLAMANSPRCMFNGRPIEDGRTVSSPEPCLNCTCSRGILLCYLRTCSTVAPAPGCDIVRKKGECCPKLECKESSDYKNGKTSEQSYKYRLRQDESSFFGLLGQDPRTEKNIYIRTTSTTRKPAPKLNYNQDGWLTSENGHPPDEFHPSDEQEEDYGSDQLSPDKNDTAGYCYHKGYKYTEGMAMLSPTKCEYCYCIRGQQMCVRPKCHLNIDGCIARYQSGYTCCPSHYQCESHGIGTDKYGLPSTSKPQHPIKKVSSCNVEGYDFDVGVAVPSSGQCQTCYCTQSGVACRRLECSPNVLGCTPIVPEGHCCPTEYKCDQQKVNETRVPISHSTENYDITVISNSETEESPQHTTETEESFEEDYDYSYNDTTGLDEEYTTISTTPEKQKITVELTDESSLESISVIPEENIAVLVVTTDKDNGEESSTEISTDNIFSTQHFSDSTKLDSVTSATYLKQKVKSTTTRTILTSDTTHNPQDTPKPVFVSLPSLKQKIKPTTVEDTTFLAHGTQTVQEATKSPGLSLSNFKQKTSATEYVPFVTDETLQEQKSTKPSLSILPGMKQKTKASTTRISSTPLTTTVTKAEDFSKLSYPAHSEPTISAEYTIRNDAEPVGEKDNTDYDYVELYEDVTHDDHKTFNPFDDYSDHSHNERFTYATKTTLANLQKETTAPVYLKNKNKKPPSSTHIQNQPSSTTASFTNTAHVNLKNKNKKHPSLSHTQNQPSSTTASFTNAKYATNGLTTHQLTETETETSLDSSTAFSTSSITETGMPTDYPTRYTIYSTMLDKSRTPPITQSSERQKQKVKPNRPNRPVSTPITPITKDTTPVESTIPQISTRIYQNTEHETTLDESFDRHSITGTNKPFTHAVKQPIVITSNHKQKPLILSQTKFTSTPTKPLPEDIAELLWSITQKYNTQDQTASTETYEPSTKQGTFTSKLPENHDVLWESLSSLAPAAPKLIVEETTPNGSDKTIQFETTNTDTPTSESALSSSGSPLPPLIFKSPEIIFSNHGPSSHRKPPPHPVRDHIFSSSQTVRVPGQFGTQSVKNPGPPGVQTVRDPGLAGIQTIRDPGLAGIQTVRDPGLAGIQTIRDPGLAGIQTVRDPNFSGMHTVKDPGLSGTQIIKQSDFLGLQPQRKPGLPVEINNHKKKLRPRPPVRFRPSSTPSVPQTSVVEISNHRPINNFRRPSTKFPPYPSYNQRSGSGHRRQQNPRDPHHTLHRINPETDSEWREDYDEYYYDFEQGRDIPTKVFTNMQEQLTTEITESNKFTDLHGQLPESNLQPTTRNININSHPIDPEVDENQKFMKSTTNYFNETTVNTKEGIVTDNFTNVNIGDSTTDKFTDVDTADTTDITIQTYSTTPHPTSTLTAETSTKVFSKHTPSEEEIKLSRAEDKIKEIEKLHGVYDGKPIKFNRVDELPSSDKHTLKPNPVLPEIPVISAIGSPASEEDSKEINDVCFVEGRYYNSGEVIVKSNPCEMCRCFYGHPLCQVQQCPSPPEPSCVLEYLPGYCCPRVTCGVKMDSSKPSEVSVPDPTSQEIKSPIITSDNQWKPLPHGPILRPVDNDSKVDTSNNGVTLEVVTAPPQSNSLEEKTKESNNFIEKESGLVTTVSSSTSVSTITSVNTATQSTLAQPPSEPIIILKTDVTTFFPEITTEPVTKLSPVFEPEIKTSNSEKKTDIHDNSSGVRKVLDGSITLPPSKVSLSPTSAENISTVLPVIQTLSPTSPSTQSPELELDTIANIVLGDLPAELGGNLKVSGCNVYGKYYKINDKVTVLSKKCRECICSSDGIACNDTC